MLSASNSAPVDDVAAGMLLALGSACGYAVAAYIQHGAVTAVNGDGGLTTRRWPVLLRQPRWLLGVLGIGCGGVLHAVALSFAPLVLVQPIGVLAIGLTVLLGAWFSHALPDRRTVVGLLVASAGITGFLVAATHSNVTVAIERPVSVLLLPSGAVVVMVAVIGRRFPIRARCLLFAGGAGVAYGTVSVLTRSLGTSVRAAGVAGIDPMTLAGAGSGVVLGLWCVQQAYVSGRPETAVACQAVVDPVAGVLLDSWLFGETASWSVFTLIGAISCASLAVVGVSC